MSGHGKGEILLALLVLTGLGCLIAGVFVSSPEVSNCLTFAAVGIASLGVLAYLIEAWRFGPVAAAAPFDETRRLYDEPVIGREVADDKHVHS